eukprot:610507_1
MASLLLPSDATLCYICDRNPPYVSHPIITTMKPVIDVLKRVVYEVEWTPRRYAAYYGCGTLQISSSLGQDSEKYQSEVIQHDGHEWEDDMISPEDLALERQSYDWNWKQLCIESAVGGAFFCYYFYSRFRILETRKSFVSMYEKIAFTSCLVGFAIRKWVKNSLDECDPSDSYSELAIGPFTYCRHPGYTGAILQHIGYGMWFHNPPSYLLFFGMISLFLLDTLPKEEALLREKINGHYDMYSKKVKYKLLPYLY